MLTMWLLVAHITVLGYWLGAEFVVNSNYRFVCFADDMPFSERSRLMDHVMDVDQHVRYALILQTTVGVMLAASIKFVPGGQLVLIGALVCGILWLGFVEAVHRLNKGALGQLLGRIDRVSRYVLMAILLAVGSTLLGEAWPLPNWLRWKLIAFACVVACGVGIRIVLIKHFKVWAEMAEHGATPERNQSVRRLYWRATSVLTLLWLFIAIVTYLSVAKPG